MSWEMDSTSGGGGLRGRGRRVCLGPAGWARLRPVPLGQQSAAPCRF